MRSTLKIFLCIVSFCISGVSFAQDLSDETIGFNAKQLESQFKKRGFTDEDAKQHTAEARAHALSIYTAGQKAQQAADDKRLRDIAAAQGSANRSTMSIPAAEKAALVALYNSTNGANWTTNMNWDVTDPNAEVTNWNYVNQTGWEGVTIENDHVTPHL